MYILFFASKTLKLKRIIMQSLMFENLIAFIYH